MPGEKKRSVVFESQEDEMDEDIIPIMVKPSPTKTPKGAAVSSSASNLKSTSSPKTTSSPGSQNGFGCVPQRKAAASAEKSLDQRKRPRKPIRTILHRMRKKTLMKRKRRTRNRRRKRRKMRNRMTKTMRRKRTTTATMKRKMIVTTIPRRNLLLASEVPPNPRKPR